jgi:ribosomal protein S27AE
MKNEKIYKNMHDGFIHNNGTCPRCGKEVMQDSQGNWF